MTNTTLPTMLFGADCLDHLRAFPATSARICAYSTRSEPAKSWISPREAEQLIEDGEADRLHMAVRPQRFVTDHGEIRVAHPVAIQALTVGGSQAAGSVAGALHTYLMTPEGGWGESTRAWVELVDAVDLASETASRGDARRAARHLVDDAIASSWERHPSRR